MQDRGRGAESLALQDLYRLIWRGSYPAIALSRDMDRDLFYSSYVQTYLQRDVRDLARVGDELAFLRFLRIAAARSGQLLNLSEFAATLTSPSIRQRTGCPSCRHPASSICSNRITAT